MRKSDIDPDKIAQRVAELIAQRFSLGLSKRITLGELCKLWGVSRRHVQRLIACGDLAAIDLSSTGSKRVVKYVFEHTEIERFEALRKSRAEEPKKRFTRRASPKTTFTQFV